MRLESLRIDAFRSVHDAELTGCAAFNVLIGKNNSGKSNILSALNLLFEVARKRPLCGALTRRETP